MVLSETLGSTSSLKLVIKAANQKYEDFIIDDVRLDWTIKNLKQHLNENYPKNPDIHAIRLIYSGKLLHDHWTLKECIRHNSDVTSHIIHLVHSLNNSNLKLTESSTSITNQNDTIGDEIDLENELTPNSSYSSSEISSSSEMSSSSESSLPTIVTSGGATNSGVPNRQTSQFSQIQNDLNNMFLFQQHQQSLTPNEKYNQILTYLTRYYESAGIQVQTNPWYSSYIQHLALYNHMHSNYIQSINSTIGNYSIPIFQDQALNNNISNQSYQINPESTPAPAPPPPQPQPRNRPANNNNNDAGDREDDWLSMLHNIVSFIVLFSIIYYYSSVERFLLIVSIVFVLILYHNGWLSLQRRQPNPRREQHAPPPSPPPSPRAQQADQENENQQQNNQDESSRSDSFNANTDQQQQQNNPNFFRLIVTFFLTFFTSLIPERPRVAN